MKDRKRPQHGRTGRLAGLILALVLAISLVPAAAFAADSYTSISKGTVSWKMINESPNTYYWKDSKGGYCALKAVRSGSYYCVTMYTTEKGSQLRYLKQKKNDDSGRGRNRRREKVLSQVMSGAGTLISGQETETGQTGKKPGKKMGTKAEKAQKKRRPY